MDGREHSSASGVRGNRRRDMYQFEDRSRRPGGRGPPSSSAGADDSYRPEPRRHEFSFKARRSERPLSFNQNPLSRDPPPPSGKYPPRAVPPSSRRPPEQDGRRRDGGRHGRPNSRFRGRGPRPATSARPLLQGQRERTPEQMMGMSDGVGRFKALEDLSDSDEQPMDVESGDDSRSDRGDYHSDVPEGQPRKRKRVEELIDSTNGTIGTNTAVVTSAETAPRWSNPDPYTSLPLSTELATKRKDVVQLIRKAKADVGKTAHNNGQPDDFISFGLESEQDNDNDDEAISVGVGMPEAPTEPSALRKTPRTNDIPGLPRVHGLPQKPSFNTGSSDHQARHDSHAIDTWPPPPPPPPLASLPLPPPLPNEPPPALPPSFQHNEPSSKRKREHDFDDPQPGLTSRTRRGRGPAAPAVSQIVPTWARRQDTPWYTVDHSTTEDTSARLHKEICDFWDYIRPRESENSTRHHLVTRLSRFVSDRYPGAELRFFGSFASGLYLPDGDMDLVILSHEFRTRRQRTLGQTRTAINKFASQLRSSRIAKHESICPIAKAKVPIVKFVDELTGLRVDISFENDTGLVANNTYSYWKAQYPAVPAMVSLVKQFLLMRGFNEVHTGGIGGFTVICLVVSMMQQMPHLQSHDLDPMQNLGEIFMSFLDLYGNKFNLSSTGIGLNPPGYFPKLGGLRPDGEFLKPDFCKPNCLTILDPNNPDNNISGGSQNVKKIFQSFADAFDILRERMNYFRIASPSNRRGSILSSLYAGDYDLYTRQRSRLEKLYIERFNSGASNLNYLDEEAVKYARAFARAANYSQLDEKLPITDERICDIRKWVNFRACCSACSACLESVGRWNECRSDGGSSSSQKKIFEITSIEKPSLAKRPIYRYRGFKQPEFQNFYLTVTIQAITWKANLRVFFLDGHVGVPGMAVRKA